MHQAPQNRQHPSRRPHQDRRPDNRDTRQHNKEKQPNERRCYICGDPGHQKYQCPKKDTNKPPGQPHNPQGNSSKPQYSPTYNNNRPKGPNQVPTALIVTSEQRQDQLLKVPCTVLGRSVELTLDTGASVSVINESWIKKEKIQTTRYAGTLDIADSKSVTIDSKIADVAIETYGNTATVDMVVRPLPTGINGLLGLNWLRKVGAVLDIAHRVLIFKQKSVSLVDGTSIPILNDGDEIHEDCLMSEELTEEDLVSDDQAWSTITALDEDIQIGDLTADDKETVIALVRTNIELFASSYLDLGCCVYGEHNIQTGETKPIFQYAYRKSAAERKQIQEEVQPSRRHSKEKRFISVLR